VITRIGRRRTFDELRRNGRRVRHGSVRLTFLPLSGPELQLAFALGRSFGNAVERNRGRRRLRAAFIDAVARVESDDSIPMEEWTDRHGAYLLAGTRGLLTDEYATLVDSVEACLAKLTKQTLMSSEPAR
jgi:ribonuclease P protein component